jgi:hypothetical protein
MKSKAIERPSVEIDGLVQSVERKIVENGDSVFQKCHANFRKLYALFCITAKLSYHNVDFRMLTGAPKSQRMASKLTFQFLETCNKDGDELSITSHE